MRRAIRAAFSVTAVMIFCAPPALAQPKPTPGTLPGSAGATPFKPRATPPLIRPGAGRRSIKTPAGRPLSGRPGVLDTGGSRPVKFNPGGATPATTVAEPSPSPGGPAPPGAAPKIEDIIEWKSNFEQGIKCRKLPLDTKIRLDFNEISLGDLTKFISCVTEQNFLLTGGANKNATVSILSPKPVSAYEAYKAYLSALEANGLTVVPNGNFLEIVPAGEGRQQGAPIYGRKGSGPNTDQMITRLIQLDHVQAEEILPVIDKFKGKASDVTVYAPTNTIILSDTGANIRRVLRLIKDLDVPIGKDKIWIRPVINASAGEIVNLLQQILGDAGKTTTAKRVTTKRNTRTSKTRAKTKSSPSSVVGSRTDLANVSVSKMIADERTNSIIFVATRTSYLAVDKIIRRIDVKIPGEGSIHIHSLENADAEELAQTLTGLTQGAGRRPTGGARGSNAGVGSGAGSLFEGEVKITAYTPKNSLVIESSLKDYLSLQKVIRQLDVRRKQVYVEAMIMEISHNNDKDVGFGGLAGLPMSAIGEQSGVVFGSGGFDLAGGLDTIASGGGAAGLIISPEDLGIDGLSEGGFSLSALGFTLKALQTTTNLNVLSTPHILTLENEEAELQVGQRRPYQSQSLGGLGNLGSLGSLAGLAGTTGTNAASALGGLGGLGSLGSLGGVGNVQYIDIDLTFKIKPQVNASNFVRLEIDQSIDDFDGLGVGDAPITSKRQVKNVVVVRDGQPVVIGGLVRDKETETVNKVPFLGDIPLIGLLFRQTQTTVEKRNLLMIIIPHVIKDPSDLKRIYERRREEYREFSRIMAERKKEFEGEMDYRKKSGMLHDIHKAVSRSRADREVRERAIFEASEVDTVGPPETHDIQYDPRRKKRGKRGKGKR